MTVCGPHTTFFVPSLETTLIAYPVQTSIDTTPEYLLSSVIVRGGVYLVFLLNVAASLVALLDRLDALIQSFNAEEDNALAVTLSQVSKATALRFACPLCVKTSLFPGYQSSHSLFASFLFTMTSVRGSGRSILGPTTVLISPVIRFIT